MNTRNKEMLEVVTKLLDEKLSTLAKKDDILSIIESQNAIIEAQSKRIEMLESTVSMLQNHVKVLKQHTDQNEQYSRRTCLRITGIPPEDNEKAASVLNKVKKVFQELDVEVPDCCIDRAHRIGRRYKKDGVELQTVICKFTTWRHRTDVYRKRRATDKYRISVDLTKLRLDLLKSARDMVENIQYVDYVFADVNCQLRVKLKDGSFFNFNNESELEEILVNNAPLLPVHNE